MSAQQAIRLIPSLPDHRDDQRAKLLEFGDRTGVRIAQRLL